MIELPLWVDGAPEWANQAWAILQEVLPEEGYWEVWIDWYDRRLLGGSRGETYELVFASVPLEVWDQGPAAANAWIKEHLPHRQDEGRDGPEPEIKDRISLEMWLMGQSNEVAIAIATRAALRVAPLVVRAARKRPSAKAVAKFSALIGRVFRASALAWVAAEYPANVKRFDYGAAADMAANAAADSANGTGNSAANVGAYAAANAVYAAAFAGTVDSYSAAAKVAELAQAAAAHVGTVADAAEDAVWDEVRVDVEKAHRLGSSALVHSSLWSRAASKWVNDAWIGFQAALPKGEDWDVWIDWYEDRLRGRTRGGAYETVFASVPQDVWARGPAAANAWIRARLPKRPEDTTPADLPDPLPDLELALHVRLDRQLACGDRRGRAKPALL